MLRAHGRLPLPTVSHSSEGHFRQYYKPNPGHEEPEYYSIFTSGFPEEFAIEKFPAMCQTLYSSQDTLQKNLGPFLLTRNGSKVGMIDCGTGLCVKQPHSCHSSLTSVTHPNPSSPKQTSQSSNDSPVFCP